VTDITVYGAPWCPDCKRSKRFLAEQRVPFAWVDIDEDAKGLRYVEELQQGGRTIPTVVFGDGSNLIDPTNEELARKLGLDLEAKRGFYDIAIIGGGPAGLAAAIYAAREGIDALVVERSGLGGQAGVTERIDNYPGFPEGIGGGDLAERFIAQARRYEVELLSAVSVEKIALDEAEAGDISLRMGNGREVSAHAALIASGSSYRRLGVPGEEDLIGAGVHFCATCDGPFYRGADELLVIGGGNSALEEGMFLTKFAKRVRIIQREPELTASRLLQDKVNADSRFVVHRNAEIVEFRGQGRLSAVVFRDRATGVEQTVTPKAAFVFIGLDPNTAFLRGSIDLDERGFVDDKGGFRTSMPGVYVAGDVRRGSTKQLGSAVGDGIAALLAMREYLQKHHEVAAHPED
jgi:thioredoxin reductase (NADPH)